MSELLKIWRSPASAFGKFSDRYDPSEEETWNVLDAYTDDELKRIADSGFNAIWVHALLHHIVQTPDYPELGIDAAEHQRRLNGLIDRAAQYGLSVFLYMQPPRALPEKHELFRNHPEIMGQRELAQGCDYDETFTVCSMCTSLSSVKAYLYNSAAELARQLPGLGGIILITASEFPAHCWSRRGNTITAFGDREYKDIECPHCRRRDPCEVAGEVIQLMRAGIRSENSAMKIIVWNWSWTMYENPPCRKIISGLPQDVTLLADFERGGKRVILGKERDIDEYSLGYAGPSEQFIESWKLAESCGLQIMAKLQIGTTHELATVANLPVIGNVYQKAVKILEMKLAGFMGTWNFGNMITANTAALNFFLDQTAPVDQNAALKNFADYYFPGANAEKIVAAWDLFGEAMASYPFSIPFLYAGPANFACILPMKPAPLSGTPVGRSWLPDERGDDMSAALSPYCIEEVIEGFTALVERWDRGVDILSAGLKNINSVHAGQELDNATVCGCLFASTLHFSQVYALRKNWDDASLPEYRRIISSEIENLKKLLPLVEKDSRFGYHIESHGYQFDAQRIKAQIKELTKQLTG
ncbi:MAG: hypothetical protein WC959_02470 [Kiritimatiellales bacterium]